MSFFKQNGLPERVYCCVQRIYRDIKHDASTLSPLRAEGLLADVEFIYQPEIAEQIRKAGNDGMFYGELSIPKLTILYGHEEIVPVLKKFNVDLEETQVDGHTLASTAAMIGRIPMLRALHEAGVNLTSPDCNGDRPMEWAQPEHGTRIALIELMEGKSAGEKHIRELKKKIISAFSDFSSWGGISSLEKNKRLNELRYNAQEFYSPYVSKRREELGIDDLIPGSGTLTIKNKAQEAAYNNHVGFIFFDMPAARTGQVLECTIDGP